MIEEVRASLEPKMNFRWLEDLDLNQIVCGRTLSCSCERYFCWVLRIIKTSKYFKRIKDICKFVRNLCSNYVCPAPGCRYMETSVNVYRLDVTIYQYYYQQVKNFKPCNELASLTETINQLKNVQHSNHWV